MQDSMAQSELPSIQDSGDLSSINSEPTGPPATMLVGKDEPTVIRKGETPMARRQFPLQAGSTGSQQHTFLPQRGLYYTAIAGVIAGVVTALLTILVTFVFAGTFHAASQQIAVDRLTVKTALALAGLELLNGTLSLLVGFFVGVIVGRIAVRRRLGFLAGVLAGTVFFLITFLVSFISGYPGNLSMKGTTLTTGSLVISFLLLCLCSISGGLVSLFGTWIATVRHPHYMKLTE